LGSNARARGGHMVEVVLGGRSTLYTVYKRPFVDYFLRKVRGVTWVLGCHPFRLILWYFLGLFVVHRGHIYSVDAGVCGPCDRLVRRWSRYFRSKILSRSKWILIFMCISCLT
jgi:hypothetical protein